MTTTTPTPAMADLLPCPFCGANDSFVSREKHGVTVRCGEPACNISGAFALTKATAADRWNRRAAQPVAPSPQAADIAELPPLPAPRNFVRGYSESDVREIQREAFEIGKTTGRDEAHAPSSDLHSFALELARKAGFDTAGGFVMPPRPFGHFTPETVELVRLAIAASRRATSSDTEIIKIFERELADDPEAYTRPGEVVYTVTQKELLRFVRNLPAPASAGQAGQVAGWAAKRKDGSGFGSYLHHSEDAANRQQASNTMGHLYEVVALVELTERAAAPADQHKRVIQFALELAEHENDDAAVSFLRAWNSEDTGYLRRNWPDFATHQPHGGE